MCKVERELWRRIKMEKIYRTANFGSKKSAAGSCHGLDAVGERAQVRGQTLRQA